ncbi:PREDICTED: beta-amyrin 28-oxidase-like [Fragaria vesca subsp. vesca]|uniref:beta-amyrin 28-oxidase-like n=1 Tax=Fragaria vesca subsp. vesca TaxID=101020 RepID=UPI0002C2F794|nr:PREDICTED: beta-amyrin 28-oxidase-like [Fragaria vesca subsp. vesca]
METITFFISLLVLFASLYYFFCKIIPSPRQQVAGYQLPPGSTGWPIIGETLEYLSTARDGVPEKFIADRRKKYSDASASSAAATEGSCKVFKTLLLGEPMAMLCTAAGNKFLFSNENKLVKTWWPAIFQKLFTDSTKLEYSKVTIHNRKAIFPFLKPDAVRKHIGVMDQVTKEHFGKHWSLQDQKQVIKFHSLVKKYTLALSSRLFLNLEDPQVIAKLQESIRHINEGLVSLPVDLPGTNFNRAIRASRKMKKEIDSMVAQRKNDLMNLNMIDREQLENAPQDLMSSFLLETRSDGQELTEEEISKYLCGIMLAGFDAIINTLCATVIVLSQLPEVYDAVLKEQMEIAESKDEGELLNWGDVRKMKYTWNVVCEVLRLQPPTGGTFREAMTDFVYEGYLIPKGMKIHWNVHATHKNPEYFPDPHKFDPSRFEGHGPPPYSYVPFGGGPRMCPGKEHARYEILVFLHNLVTRFKWEMVFPDEKMVVDPVPFPSKGLPLHVFPRI